jgi:hypothetical protein
VVPRFLEKICVSLIYHNSIHTLCSICIVSSVVSVGIVPEFIFALYPECLKPALYRAVRDKRAAVQET